MHRAIVQNIISQNINNILIVSNITLYPIILKTFRDKRKIHKVFLENIIGKQKKKTNKQTIHLQSKKMRMNFIISINQSIVHFSSIID